MHAIQAEQAQLVMTAQRSCRRALLEARQHWLLCLQRPGCSRHQARTAQHLHRWVVIAVHVPVQATCCCYKVCQGGRVCNGSSKQKAYVLMPTSQIARRAVRAHWVGLTKTSSKRSGTYKCYALPMRRAKQSMLNASVFGMASCCNKSGSSVAHCCCL